MSMYLCIYGVFEVGNLFQTIEMKVCCCFPLTRFYGEDGVEIVCNNIWVCRFVRVEFACQRK